MSWEDNKKKRKKKRRREKKERSTPSEKSVVSEEEEEDLDPEQRLKLNMKKMLENEDLSEFQSEYFNHLEVVGKTLDTHHGFKKVDLMDEVKTLKKHRKHLRKTVETIVDVNCNKFNQTLQNFTDILRDFESSRKKVSILHEKIKACESLLKLRTKYLKNLNDDYQINREYVKLLEKMKTMKEVPSLLKKSLEGKHFLFAVNLIHQQSKTMKDPKFRGINGLEPIRRDIRDVLENLPENLFTELIDLCYRSPTIDPSPVQKHKENMKQRNLIKESKRRRRSRAGSGSAFITTSGRKRYVIRDHPNVPIRPYSEKYLRIIVETLYKLSQLNQAKTRLHQSLHLNLTALVAELTQKFLQRVNSSEEAYDFVQGKLMLDELSRVKLQKPCLLAFFKEVFREFIRVLKNFRFVLSLIDEKDRLGREMKGLQESLQKKGVHKKQVRVSEESALNQRLTKEVLVRLRESLRFRLERMKDRKTHKAYKASIQDLLGNFIEKEIMGQSHEVERGDMTVRTLHEMFVDKLRSLTQQSVEVSSYIRKFKALLIDCLSKVDELSKFTMHDVYGMVQVVLREKLLQPLLQFGGDMNESSTNIGGKAKKNVPKNTQFSFSSQADDEWAQLLKQETIIFRYNLNIQDSGSRREEKQADVPFKRYFACTPYNMVWLYFPLLDFVKNAELAVGPTEFDEYQLVRYIHKQMETSLVKKTRSDYLRLTVTLLKRQREGETLFRPIQRGRSSGWARAEMESDPKALVFRRYVQEMVEFHEAMPKFSKDFSLILENCLVLFHAKLHEQVVNTTRPTLVRKYLVNRSLKGHSSLYRTMCRDPAYLRIYDELASDLLLDDDDGQEQLTFELTLRDSFHEKILYLPKIFSHHLLQRSSQVMLLAHIHNISEWLFEEFVHEEFLRKLENVTKYQETANESLFTLKLDIHVHCFFHLKKMFRMIYERERKPQEPEEFVQQLNQDLNRIERSCRPYMSPRKIQYLFDGVTSLICGFLLDALEKVEHQKFNTRGVMQVQRNIVALQQNLTQFTVIHRRGEEMFQKVRAYYGLLNLSPEKFFNHVKNVIEENRPVREEEGSDDEDGKKKDDDVYLYSSFSLEEEDGELELSGLEETPIILPYTQSQYMALLNTEDLDDDEYGPKTRKLLKSIFKTSERLKKKKISSLLKNNKNIKKQFQEDEQQQQQQDQDKKNEEEEEEIEEEEENEGEESDYEASVRPPKFSAKRVMKTNNSSSSLLNEEDKNVLESEDVSKKLEKARMRRKKRDGNVPLPKRKGKKKPSKPLPRFRKRN